MGQFGQNRDDLKSKSDAPMTEAEMLAKLETREQGMYKRCRYCGF